MQMGADAPLETFGETCGKGRPVTGRNGGLFPGRSGFHDRCPHHGGPIPCDA